MYKNYQPNIIKPIKKNYNWCFKMSCFEVILRLKAFFKNQPKIKQELAIMYRRRFQLSMFYEVCVAALRFINMESTEFSQFEEEDELPFQRQATRKSVTQVSHYENARISAESGGFGRNSSSSQERNSISQQNQIPSTLQYMSIAQKQQLLKQLIQQSYLFIDLTDLFSGQDLQVYQSIVKGEIFDGEQSIMMDSILEVNNQNNRKGVKNKLKYFDSEALHLLNVYVRFCNRMQGQMSGGEESSVFLSRLVLQLKARLQLNYPSEKLQNNYAELNKFVQAYHEMTDIIMATIEKTQRITIIPQISSEYAQNFFTHPNIATLVSVLLFMDEGFLEAVFERFLEGLKLAVGRMAEKLIAIEKKFIQQLKAEYFGYTINVKETEKNSSRHQLFTYKSNLQKILQGTQQSSKFPYFRKSLRTLQTLTTYQSPYKCLKIIYELNKTIQKQHTEFINSIIQQQLQQSSIQQSSYSTSNSRYDEMRRSQRQKKYSYSRETQEMIIEFLLARKKQKLRFIVGNVMMAQMIVHGEKMKDKKGSCMVPFVNIIKKMGLGDKI